MKIGIIREGKNPPDKRVPFTPSQCVELQDRFPSIQVVVQTSPIRAFKDEEYATLGITVQEDMSSCDVLMGVKEVPLDMLIPDKKYFFFSHTFKEQPYNRKLLQGILDRRIQLIDYEVLKDADGSRIIGFGRYAGVVGTYNGFRCWGEKFGTFKLKPAHACNDRTEMESYLSDIVLPADFKMVMTGHGRVGQGAREIVDKLPIREVSTEDYLTKSYEEPVFCHIDADDYNDHQDGRPWDRKHFYAHPQDYVSVFYRFAQQSDMYIACHYWDHEAPQILTAAQLQRDDLRIKVISDISCDIKEPIASTIRPATIAEPFYGYDPQSGEEVPLDTPGSIGVQAVDNLPCELPKDASKDFGRALIDNVVPHLIGTDEDKVIARASETNLKGELTEYFSYLEEYLKG